MWRVVLVLVILAVAVGAYFYMFERASLERVLDGTPLELPASTTEVYKWRDDRGRWHITDEPPAAGIAFEKMRYRSNDNILPVVPSMD